MPKGCPYRDKNGKTCSKEEAERVIYEPNKDKDIARNKQEADRLNNALNKQYKQRQSKQGSKAYYDTKKILEHYKFDIDKLDANDVESVEQLAIKIINSSSDPACYRVAGTVAAILDYKKVKYKCWNGYCEILGKPIEKEIINHTWIEANGKIYENFPNYKKSQLGKHIKIEEVDL